MYVQRNHIKKVYDILQQHRYSVDAAVVNLREAFETASFLYAIYNNGQEIKVKRNVSRAVLTQFSKKSPTAIFVDGYLYRWGMNCKH